MRDKGEELQKRGVLRQFLCITVIMTDFLLMGYFSPHSAYAGHTTAGAWAEYPDIIYCVHCHQQIIVSGNPDGTNRTIVSSPSITGTSRATHTKRADWTSTVSSMLSKCGSACSGSSASAIAGYYNAYYCSTCTAPYYSIAAAPTSSSATVTYKTGYASSNGQACYGTSSGSMTTCVSETTSGTNHSIDLTGLPPGTTYYYKILFTDSTGRNFDTSADAAVESFATLAPTVPTPPSNLTAQVQGWSNPSDYTTINLAWQDNSTDETGFEIERNSASLTTVGAGVSTYSDSGLATTTAYSYQVRACNANGCSAYSNTASATTGPETTAPTAPGTPTVTNVGDGSSLGLAWAAAADPESGVDHYVVYRDSVPVTTGNCASPSGTSCTDGGLTSGVQYCYVISAVNKAGLEGALSSQGCGTPTSATATISSLVDGSARANVQTGTNILNGGFTIDGDTPMQVLIRARGPSMGTPPFNLPGVLADPFVKLYSAAAQAYIAQNDNWQTTDPLCASPAISCGNAQDILATGLDPCEPNPGQTSPPANCDKEAALLLTLPPGAYSAVVSGVNNTTGLGLFEVFNRNSNTTVPKLRGVSGRAFVGIDASRLLEGFIINGDTPMQVLIRARGPSMGTPPFNLPGVLADPFVKLYSAAAQAYIAQNDNWQTTDPLCASPAIACGTPQDILNMGLDPCEPNPGQTSPPANCDKEAALLVTLPPGTYTAIVNGVNNTTGTGLVEVYDRTPLPPWMARYNGSANQNDVGVKVVADSSGNAYATGWSFNGSNYDYLTAKYNSAGTQLWTARYDSGRGDFAPDMVVDGSGNVYVTGWSNNGTSYDAVTIKYDANGNQLWLARYDNGGTDAGFRVQVDGSGNVYVAGNSSNGSNDDYVVVKYDSAGNQLWASRYNNGGSEGINSMALDTSGNVYVTGWSNDGSGVRDYATVKYDTNGNQLWVARYNGPANQNDVGAKVVADSSGNVYVTGWSFNGSNYDYLTVKYDPAGTQLWAKTYDSSRGDFAPDMVVDGSGNVYVTGWSNNGTNYDAVTIKYDANGNQLWLASYDNGGNDAGFRVAVDSSGNVVVGGNSSNGTNDDYVMLKYNSAGTRLWVARYDNGSSEGINSMALNSSGNVYATGWSNDGSGIRDYATVKYSSLGP